MKITLTKQSDQEHILHILRKDGSEDFAICETRSFLLHDLTHFAFETETNEREGFWGSLASGESLADLSDRFKIANLEPDSKIMKIEKAVAVFQCLAKDKTVESIVENYLGQKPNFDWAYSEWFEVEFVERVNKHLRKLVGQWRSTKFGESMTIHWDL